MKKLLSIMLGLGLAIGTLTVSFAQEKKDEPKTEKKKKTSKKKVSKKKVEEPK